MRPRAILEQFVPTLYEDDHLLAVNKPAGIDAGRTRPGAAAGLAEMLSEWRGRGESFQIANPLSRYESGVLLLGKEPAIVQHLRTGLRANRITLEYVAVVLGRMSRPRLVIDPAHGASRGQRKGVKPKEGKRRETGGRAGAAKRQTLVHAMRAGRKRTL